MKIFTRNFW